MAEDLRKHQCINVHSHVFLGKNIPPYIAKTFIPWPFYFIFDIRAILYICKFWFNNPSSPYNWERKPFHKQLNKWFYYWRITIARIWILDLIVDLLNLFIAYHGIVFLLEWLVSGFIVLTGDFRTSLTGILPWLSLHRITIDSLEIKWAFIISTFLFISYGRKLILMILKKAWSILSWLPDKRTLQFLRRYVDIGRFAYYENPKILFKKLTDQYPVGMGFVLLPMDMEFMEAGKLAADGVFGRQMEQLDSIKQASPDTAFPFVFVDPRRDLVDNKPFLAWSAENGSVTLKNCFIKTYIEEKKFNGFKIYPALGYYPFDEKLLPLWKYAADHKLPIMTHAIKGTIFYRGKKNKNWDTHPIFKEGGSLYENPLLLNQVENVDFINNFTHPLNYLCLIEEKLLRIVVSSCSKEIKDLFGYVSDDKKLKHDLRQLKMCFGHFGGDDEWARYLRKDRDATTAKIINTPESGAQFFEGEIKESYGMLSQIWHHLDWYSIISSMMLQYPNVYADISYIIHDEHIFPLLKSTLMNEKLAKRTLFGTDFYVVRNHKSEKQMFSEINASLNDIEIDNIARDNPREYLFGLRDIPIAP